MLRSFHTILPLYGRQQRVKKPFRAHFCLFMIRARAADQLFECRRTAIKSNSDQRKSSLDEAFGNLLRSEQKASSMVRDLIEVAGLLHSFSGATDEQQRKRSRAIIAVRAKNA